ncbi:unnamed protein product [Pneumocystis jirovecii]|uniref:Ribosomal protein eL8/eL30/eS12/Gadd45 domain-containing protein n=1 Tax=Pneumocystis jirovecii TaxID=42068 RepID=L0PDG4_PNEJI|nr:unnamed protein product [Pneumocystis jirovecii]
MGKSKKEKKDEKKGTFNPSNKKKISRNPHFFIVKVDNSEKKHKKTDSDDYIDSLSPIANPLAPKKLRKRVLKTLRKGKLVILAGDISPIDVISHLPVLCEDYSCPYVFVPSKESLGEASNTQRPTSCIMIIPGGKNKDLSTAKETYMETYEEVLKQIENAHTWSHNTDEI